MRVFGGKRVESNAKFAELAEAGAGLGMNEEELKRNVALTEFVVKDLNEGQSRAVRTTVLSLQ